MNDREFYWDWLKHSDNLFVQRSILFVFAETALFAATAAPFKPFFTAMIYLLGLFVTVIWLYVGIIYSRFTVKHISDKLKDAEPRLEEYIQNHYNGIWKFRINKLLGVILPACVLFLWLVLCLTQLF